MLYAEFVRKVQEYAGLASPEEAKKAIDATLETLGERLSRQHRKHLAAQLPSDLHPAVLKRNKTDRFSLEQFYLRVSAWADIVFHQALKQSCAVTKALREAVAAGDLADILSEIPAEFESLLERKQALSSAAVDVHELFPGKKSGPAFTRRKFALPVYP